MLQLVAPEAVGMNSAQLARVGEHLRRRYVQPGKIPGFIALVARRTRGTGSGHMPPHSQPRKE